MPENTHQKHLACRELLEMVLDGSISSTLELNAAKKRVSQKYKLPTLPSNPDITMAGNEAEQKKAREILRRKPVRTISGVAVIAAMTSPAPCPHGACVPCPGGPDSRFNSPQSYMGQEPAAMRAIHHNYDPYSSVTSRLTQLQEIGHDIHKAELIVMGGTFTSRSLDYQEWFTKRCLEAMNDYYGKDWRDGVGSGNTLYITLETVQKANEVAAVRNTGITFETRPDWARKEHVDRMLKLGATKVEIGVQSIYNYVLTRINRGHTVEDTIEANRILRDSGLKVGFHMMPHLPGMSTERDLRSFRTLFEDSRFMPDYLKIYPTLVTEGTKLYDMWKQGEYKPPDDVQSAQLLADIKECLPEWVRLQRIQRDIPAHQIFAGNRKSNIRQLARNILDQRGAKCRCIRCREVGHRILQGSEPDPSNIEMRVQKYQACGGTEHFITFEDTVQDLLVGFLRLRFPALPHRPELENAAVVRELHVYGSMVPVGQKAGERDWQHRGYGTELLEHAESIAEEAGYNKLAIISGIGVRDYYRKLGYESDGPYMSRELNH
ncbi:histone acetyltransferase, ELP3 family [Methanosalsum zhilinae DSM 4017]|uniref:tRNA carboxymethyluridine synthase n=1 Tax=Methanosalsum zhilinae (strain DSM 4017 / NBRC 107636 / OCM 62 / WeN5) TaxID=679901 RepID=F7XQB1_METZD|nr:tRNA uridine(34) 5-carboxymethylaminomethyl modification radical SAM/GNAT enzyme Elp3 [Methanosalsum zhilinae]AEH61573.1 histone acetyltransferase, ELP3 family [Methanosalsum zhilinae DSM 4017]